MVARKPVIADFSGGQLSSDAGVLLLTPLDRQLGLTQAVTGALQDRRAPTRVDHSLLDLIRQRVCQIACGYEDANDADTPRRDPLFKSAVGRTPERGADLASQPTFSRLENADTRQELPEQELLVALLRPMNREASFRARSILARLLPLVRAAWPGVEVIVRADSGSLAQGQKRSRDLPNRSSDAAHE